MHNRKIVIIDYDTGNPSSVLNMLNKIGYKGKISANKEDIKTASHCILPGVGHFNYGVKNLKKRDLFPLLSEFVMEKKKPILGICLGMQMFAKGSEEGDEAGLGWIDALVRKFKLPKEFKVPHMGWNTIQNYRKSKIFDSIPEEPRFYFVHSYFMECKNKSDIAATTNYGIDFSSSILQGNIWGVQFHPEKSHKFGMVVLKNFVEKNS